MSQRLIAACGGDSVKLFDASAASEGRADPCVSTFLPSLGVQVNAVRWNHTNHVLASSGEDRKISLWLKGGKLLGSVPQPDTDTSDILDESILAINFSTKSSRYLCSGGTGKVVRIWDMQRKRCIKWLKGHMDTITGVMYNCKDEHLASISTRGDLIVYSLASGSRVTEVKDPSNQVLRVLEYARSSRHLLLTAGDDGSIHLWDTTGRSPKASWTRQHLAPTTGLCFCTSNDQVIASVGLDKRLHTYDIGTRKPVNSISCDAPFSSLIAQDDGWTLAAGTNNGKIIFYDIRNKVQPLAILRAFNPSETVASLSWQHSNPVPISNSSWSPDVALLGSTVEDTVVIPDPLPSTKARQPTTGSFGRLSSSLTVPNPKATSEEDTPNNSVWSKTGSFILHSARNLSTSVDDMEVFSPLVDVQPIVQPLSSYMDGLNEARKPFVDSSSMANASKDTVPNVAKLPRQDEFSSLSTRAQIASLRYGKNSRPELLPGNAEGEQSSRMSKPVEYYKNSADLSTRLSAFSSPSFQDSGPNSPTSGSRKAASYIDRSTLDKRSEHGSESGEPENGSAPVSGPCSPRMPGSAHAVPKASPQGSSSFALQLVQRALEESLGSVQRAIHEDVQNLHLELLRQFHIQQTEVAFCIDKLLAKQAEMMEEIQALRKENQQLRHLI